MNTPSPSRSPNARCRLPPAVVPLVALAIFGVSGAAWLYAQTTGPATTAPARTGPWGDPAAPEEGLANWGKPRVDAYQQKLASIAAWAKATFPAPGIQPHLKLPPALEASITHGPIEAILTADGQVILLVQFYDISISSGSTGVAYATPAFTAKQLATRDGRPTLAIGGVWTNSLTRRVTPNLYRAELDEETQDVTK